MRVRVDGIEVEVPKDATIETILKENTTSYDPRCIVALVRREGSPRIVTDQYVMETNKGKIVLKVNDLSLWKEIEHSMSGLRVYWKTRRVISMGTLSYTSRITDTTYEYDPGTVILSIAEGNGYLIFTVARSRVEHYTEGTTAIGRVIRGFDTLEKLDVDDYVIKIEPIIRRKYSDNIIRKVNLTDRVLENDEIISTIEIDLNIDLPLASEHLLMSLQRDTTISEVTETYIKLTGVRRVLEIEENPEKRAVGTVTIRVSGNGEGNIYVYKQERMPSKNHSVVGYVRRGMELLEVAEEGDKLHVITNPKRIDVVGLTQATAEKMLNSIGIAHIRDGNKADDALIVSQSPETTSEILKMKRIITYGLDSSKVIKIRLFDDIARRTSSYFRIVTGLLERRVGSLAVFFKTDDLILFKPDDRRREYYREPLIPENTPRDIVKQGDMGITNMSSRYAGFIGIRLTDSEEYGPTAETFESTNIIGKIVDGLDVVRELEEGETLYLMEAI